MILFGGRRRGYGIGGRVCGEVFLANSKWVIGTIR